MKPSYFLLLGLIVVFNTSFIVLRPPVLHVDERVELLGIAYQLAMHGEVPEQPNPVYAKAINRHFKPFAAHPFIVYLKAKADNLAKTGIDIGAWEIPSLAVHLSPAPEFEPLSTFVDTSDGWDNRTLLDERMLSLMRAFYKEAKCRKFFKQQVMYYSKLNTVYRRQGEKVEGRWVERFFGLKPTETYFPIFGLSANFGWAYVRTNFDKHQRNTHTIFGTDTFDENGFPADFNNPSYAAMMLHEYIHCFSNQVIDAHEAQLFPAAERLLANPEVQEGVKNTFYANPRYLMYESLVRSVSIRYKMRINKDIATVEQDFLKQEKAGFLWIRPLVDLLGKYESNRAKYRNFGDFMPEFIAFFEKTAADCQK